MRLPCTPWVLLAALFACRGPDGGAPRPPIPADEGAGGAPESVDGAGSVEGSDGVPPPPPGWELLRPGPGEGAGPEPAATRKAPEQPIPPQGAASQRGRELEPRLEEGERERLRSAAEADLASARGVIEATDTQALDEAQLERFDVLLDLVERAVAALETDRVQEARQLAEKASVLARDLAPRG